ncbi:hypothetical protein EG68_10678 [Paragonimus skrjabini miyazakii]|uniref:Uncharacterized protein n=1 Tax=Paragonimus skrjabini miyazakii TaxID=59628 RepID=A0A8S9YIT7_9TREM|nr:hypothetical protein EG68_10678 [Paragonimus skrjabini miyazakii]
MFSASAMSRYRKPDDEETVNSVDPEGIKRGEYKKMDTYDFVRRDIERFINHPEEAVICPELLKSKDVKPPPDFVRNVPLLALVVVIFIYIVAYDVVNTLVWSQSKMLLRKNDLTGSFKKNNEYLMNLLQPKPRKNDRNVRKRNPNV